MEQIKADICIIGAGSGGLSVAAGAAQMGASVVLIEGHKMGGDCLNFGCVPSKALIAAGKVAHGFKGGFGVAAADPVVDYAAAKDHVAGVIAAIEPHDSQERFEGLGVRVIRDYGRFISPREVQAGDHVIRARRFVIATGSRPFVPPIPGLDGVPYETNETIFDLRERPGHLLVVGSGPIGLEMAQAHARLGSKVTAIEGMKALGRDDPELAAIALDKLRAEGIEIAEDALAAQISGGPGDITIQTKDGRSFHGTHLLMAVGRAANIDKLGLEAAGITHDRAIAVDAGMRTSNRKVYAIGDVAGGLQFTHVAGYHAGLVIRSALLGLPAKARTDHLPWATYTDPEIGQVGMTEAEARARHGDAVEVIRVRFDQIDRALATGKTTGLIKAMVVKGRAVGVSVVGDGAGELVAFWSLAIAQGLKMSQIASQVAPYPTISEINKRVAGAYFTPRLFDSKRVKTIVRAVQRWLP